MKLMRLLSLGLLLLLAAWSVAWAQASGGGNAPKAPADVELGKRYALVIGNSDYKHATPLTNPVNDARAVCDKLRALQFEVDCRENIQRRGDFRAAVGAFIKRIRNTDVALFYYAGHGLELEGENYLIPTGADIRSRTYVEDEAVRVNFVLAELGMANARLSIIILDACRNNPFARSIRSVGSGLAAPSNVPSGSIIIFPTSPGQTALDGDGVNGVFTSHLLQHITTTGISIEEMFKRVIHGVRQESMQIGAEQVPWMNLSFTGEFCFVGCGTRVSEADYANVLKAKADVEKVTQTLQSELTTRETELQLFKTRMIVMQQQFENTQKSQNLSSSELEKLRIQRDELAAKTLDIQNHESELNRVKRELEQLQAQQIDNEKREQEMADARVRIASLEQKINHQESRKLGDSELEKLRIERDSLMNSNAELQKQQKNGELLQQELAALQNRLSEYDKQKADLDIYKSKLAQMESEQKSMRAEISSERSRRVQTEEKLKDAAVNTVKDAAFVPPAF